MSGRVDKINQIRCRKKEKSTNHPRPITVPLRVTETIVSSARLSPSHPTLNPTRIHSPYLTSHPIRNQRNQPPLIPSESKQGSNQMNCLRTTAARALRPRTIAPLTTARYAGGASTSNFDDTSEYKSPFASPKPHTTTKIPDFSKYRGGSTSGNKLFGYFMVGTMGILSAAGAKATIQGPSPPSISIRRQSPC